MGERTSIDATKPHITGPIVWGPTMIRRNTFKWIEADGTEVWQLHRTIIVRKLADGTVALFNGGHRTPITKERINSVLGELRLPYSIFAEDRQWKLWNRLTGHKEPFKEGMTI